MYLPNEKGVNPEEVREVEKDDYKGDWPENIEEYAKFLRYELSTVYQNKNGNSTKEFKQVHRFDSMKSIFQPEGDDDFSIFPRIDITDYVYLFGDYFVHDLKEMKAYTEFKIKVDWLEVHKETWDRM